MLAIAACGQPTAPILGALEPLDVTTADNVSGPRLSSGPDGRLTLSWTDPAGPALTGLDNRSPALVHDLDLRVIAPDGGTSFPYRLDVEDPSGLATTGDNDVPDNVTAIASRMSIGEGDDDDAKRSQ